MSEERGAIEFELAEFFADHGYTFTVRDELGQKVRITPDDNDFGRILDDAAGMMYNEAVGNRMNLGRLIIEKREKDFDVYVYVGSYN